MARVVLLNMLNVMSYNKSYTSTWQLFLYDIG
jgi:hypothetical protein